MYNEYEKTHTPYNDEGEPDEDIWLEYHQLGFSDEGYRHCDDCGKYFHWDHEYFWTFGRPTTVTCDDCGNKRMGSHIIET